MTTSRSRHLIGVIAAVVVLGGLFVGLVFGVRAIDGLGFDPRGCLDPRCRSARCQPSPTAAPVTATARAPGRGRQPHLGDLLSHHGIRIPAYSSRSRVTIKQYDTATPLHNPFFATVTGTVGNVMYVNRRPVHQISPNAPAHTFAHPVAAPTPSATKLYVSVPLPGCGAARRTR